MSRRALRSGGERRAWLRQHGYSLLSSLGALLRAPLSSGLTVAVLAFALSLPLGLETLVVNLKQLASALDRFDGISVFMDLELGGEDVRRRVSQISAWPEVLAVDPVPPEQGLEELAGATGLAPDAIENIRLPWVLQVAPANGRLVEALAARLEALAGVDQVIIDLDWLRRLQAILALFERAVVLLAVLFALAVLFVISNTTRTEIDRRREEIEVLALVGATPGFIRRPFLYGGLWMSTSAAVLAFVLVHAALWALRVPVEQLADSYAGSIELLGPSPERLGLLLLVAALLGLAGAWLAVARQLRRINP
ncbi:MAG: permease-like cell division protein FtsX [Wenzhouxiangellaceae bacterium]|nr:permease-like cell division protein FtsX [Wenzhouxiangellaceae bacterium]